MRDGRLVTGAVYRIVVGGHVDPRLRADLGGLEVEPRGEETVLTGSIVDQAQLQGLLERIAALHLVLVSICRVDPTPGRRY